MTDTNSLFQYRRVAPCLSDAQANVSLSGFSSGRVTKVRSVLGDDLEFVAPTEVAVSAVRSNATGLSVCVVRVSK